jgi:hypothetical protein
MFPFVSQVHVRGCYGYLKIPFVQSDGEFDKDGDRVDLSEKVQVQSLNGYCF